jgi:hypothetical protein
MTNIDDIETTEINDDLLSIPQDIKIAIDVINKVGVAKGRKDFTAALTSEDFMSFSMLHASIGNLITNEISKHMETRIEFAIVKFSVIKPLFTDETVIAHCLQDDIALTKTLLKKSPRPPAMLLVAITPVVNGIENKKGTITHWVIGNENACIAVAKRLKKHTTCIVPRTKTLVEM